MPGPCPGAVVTFVDVSNLAEAEQHQALLISELNHRVNNIFGVEIAWQQKNGKVQLNWTEKDGPSLMQDAESGFGIKLIENETRSGLQGDVEFSFDKAGLDVKLTSDAKDRT